MADRPLTVLNPPHPTADTGDLPTPAFLQRHHYRDTPGGWLIGCPDTHASSGFAVFVRADTYAGRYRLQCLEASNGDLCGHEGELIHLLGIAESELKLIGAAAAPFHGLTHAQAIAQPLPEISHLISDLIDTGVVGFVAGLPETHKTWLAQAIAVAVAQGQGEILGCQVAAQGPTGYFWQDDSERNELERIQTFACVRETPTELEITWFLNQGLTLPEDTQRLRATIEAHEFVLVVLDSFYNVADATVDLKAEASTLVKSLKEQVCDETGCTILIVDHMPWATDTNRLRLRTYGDVFKGAAARFGIYIDAERKKLFVEARGNNIRGFPRSPAIWDNDTLEIRLLEGKELDQDKLDAEVLLYIQAHPGAPLTKIRKGVTGGNDAIDETLVRLAGSNLIEDRGGLKKGWTSWFPRNQPDIQHAIDFTADSGTFGTIEPGLSQSLNSPNMPPSYKEAGSGELKDVPKSLSWHSDPEDE